MESKIYDGSSNGWLFEFALMRVGTHLDQKVLSELFHQYLNVEDDFSKELFWGTETKLGRAFVQERVLNDENSINILDYEKQVT